ncbi:MAG: UDP-glucose 4-epimerase [Thermoleophilaceae bacterium]|jgi:UDP-glucose 4-epimerase|nr:UDP-glucose 4-epimerase [Thermoleophilaceae bacterium]
MRYLITGGSGYIGSRLVERLAEREDAERILICDVRPPRVFRPGVSFRQVDVRDGAAVSSVVSEERPDALVHLAFILNPLHDEALMYEIDVGGTHNVLEACSAAGVEQVLVTSSSTAYGAFPDNPVPLSEDHPVRGVPEFEYARDKAESDRLCQLWALRHPDRVMTIVRPCIVFGPSVDNYLVRLWTKQPFQADFGLADPGIQFVHEDDVVEALLVLLSGRHSGAFNVASDDVMSTAECASIIGLPRRRVPLGVMRRFAALMWRLRASEAPPGSLDFALYPWIVSNEKLKRETGWSPRFSSRETFEITMRTHGKLADTGPAAAVPTPAAAA